MGMTIETLKISFPRSYKEFQKVEGLIDKYVVDSSERATLKASIRMLMIVMADEVSGASRVISSIWKLLPKR